MKNLLMAMLALALLTMASCSSEPSKPAETEKPQPKAAELQTGRYAFQKLYVDGAWLGARCAAVPAGIAGYIGLLRAKTGRRMYGTRRSRLPQGTGRRLMYGRARMPRMLPRAESFLAPRTVTVPRILPPRSLILAFCTWTRTRHLKLPSNMGAIRCWRRLRILRSYTCSTGITATNALVWQVFYGNSRDDAKLTVDVNGTTGEFIRVEK